MPTSDEELARRLQEDELELPEPQQARQRSEIPVAQSSVPTATLGYLQTQPGQLPFTEKGRALFDSIKAYRSQSGAKLTGDAMASGVTSAISQTAQHVRCADTTSREGMSFPELMRALTMPGERELASISFDRTSFWEAHALMVPVEKPGGPAKLRRDLINGTALITSHRLLFLTLSGGEVVNIEEGGLPQFNDANAGCFSCFCPCFGEPPEPGFHYNVSTTKETGNTFVSIEHEGIQRGISFSVSTRNSFAVGVSFRPKADACCCCCCPSFSYPPAFGKVRNLNNENDRTITVGMRLPPWGTPSTVQITVSKSNKLVDITKFVSKLQEMAGGDDNLPAHA